MFSEQYHGDEAGTCVGGERTFGFSVEGTEQESNFDICALTQAANTAYLYVVSNVVTGADNVLNISLYLGTTGTDKKPELAGIQIATHVATGDTLTLSNAAPSTSITNAYPSITNINPSTVCGASSTVEDAQITIDGALNTASLTAGSAAISEDLSLIEYTPADANADTDGVGSITLTLTDGEDTESCTITISSIIREKRITLFGNTSRGKPTSTTGWGYCIFDFNPLTDGITDTIRLKETTFCGNTTTNTLDSNAMIIVSDSRLPDVGTRVFVMFFNHNSITVGGSARTRDTFVSPVTVTR